MDQLTAGTYTLTFLREHATVRGLLRELMSHSMCCVWAC